MSKIKTAALCNGTKTKLKLKGKVKSFKRLRNKKPSGLKYYINPT